MRLTLDVTNEIPELNQRLMALNGRLNDLSPLMDAIGDILENSTRQRFEDQVNPDGISWEDLLPSTVKAKKGNDKILSNEGDLLKSLTYGFDETSVEWGTPEEYGKYHQTGTIFAPERAFLGISDDDREDIFDVLNEFIADAWQS